MYSAIWQSSVSSGIWQVKISEVEAPEQGAAKTALRNSKVLPLSAVGSKLYLPAVHVDGSSRPLDCVLCFGQGEHELRGTG